MILSFILKLFKAFQRVYALFFTHLPVYTITGAFKTRRFPPAKTQHRYGVLIAARNEEAVIAKLIESIRSQDYPQELIQIFVVADNCTDNTARAAREAGAVCYERCDTEHRTKGYALQFLVEQIHRDYGKEAFEGFFIFDADNLLREDYISRMNDSFDAGEKIITSYRNTKNFDDNWISASYALHWLRTVRYEHRARSLFRLATRIQGTGLLIANELFANGWQYTSLTEDREFSADAVVNGYRISFNYEAQFYDEQPTDLKIALRQRLRWAKGNLFVFTKSGGKLFKGIFRKKPGVQNFICYDMLVIVFPRAILSVILSFSVFLCSFFLAFLDSGLPGFLSAAALSLLSSYFTDTVSAAYVFFAERKRIPEMKWYRKLWYCLTFPLFDLIGTVSMWTAMFTHVEWKPIPHKVSVGINEIKRK